MERPDFIPFFRQVIDHDTCTNLDAVLFGYIYWLTKLKNEKCYASNETLAELCKSTATSVQNSLTTLERAGFIRRMFKNNNPRESRLEIIPLLGFTKLSPTGGRGYHPQVIDLSPTGDHSNSIKEEHINSAFEDEQRVIVSLKEEGEERATKSNAKYPHAKEVFAWFPKPQASWMSLKNVQEREYAEYLYERGEKNVKRALTFYEEYKDEPFCPKINKPSDLEKKWLDLTNFAKKLDA